MRVEQLELVLWLWLISMGAAALLSLPVLIAGRRRAQWAWWELSAFILPFSCWAFLMFARGEGKSLANFVECLVISPFVPLAALARVVLGRQNRYWAAPVGIAILCAVAMLIYFLTPCLPE
jgi:hypothetical protein